MPTHTRARTHTARVKQCPRTGLRTEFRGGTVRDVAQDVLAIAKKGLRNRKHKEVHFLDRLLAMVESGETGADRLLREYEEHGSDDLDWLYKANSPVVY